MPLLHRKSHIFCGLTVGC